MPVLIAYLLKLSVALAAVFLFYQLVLRRLTFYNWNRWYLLLYTAAAFCIPLIDVNPVLEEQRWSGSRIVNLVPVLQQGVLQPSANTGSGDAGFRFDAWDIVQVLLLAGMLLMLLRLAIQFISVRRMKKRASLVNDGAIKIYQVDEAIIPFSFGNAVFINRSLHDQAALQEIIRHEFIHIKQRHTVDMLWTEFLCLVNWYNPFAWLLKKTIRQNLEFIADNKVLENGVPRKEYQYLLLNVIGNHQYSIATPFNFSSLKKRIAMMNKTKSARRQLLRLLFLLPATAVLLLAFRSKLIEANEVKAPAPAERKVMLAGIVLDADTKKPLPGVSIHCREQNLVVQTDANGYYRFDLDIENKPLRFSMQLSKPGYDGFSQYENWGNFYEDHIYSRFGRTIELFALGKKGNNNSGYSLIAANPNDEEGLLYPQVRAYLPKLYKQIDEPEDYVEMDTVPAAAKDKLQSDDEPRIMTAAEKNFLKRHPKVKELNWGILRKVTGDGLLPNKAGDVFLHIYFTNGKFEVYQVNSEKEQARFKKNYGEPMPDVPIDIIEMGKTTFASPVGMAEPLFVEARPLAEAEIPVAAAPALTLGTTQPARVEEVAIASSPALLETASVGPAIVREERLRGFLAIGGLTLQDEGQYIIVDGKEYNRQEKLDKKYRISFLDKKEAEAKYGGKAHNGAIIVETINN